MNFMKFILRGFGGKKNGGLSLASPAGAFGIGGLRPA